MPNRELAQNAGLQASADNSSVAMSKIGYWAATGLIALVMVGGGVMDVLQPPDVVAGMVETASR